LEENSIYEAKKKSNIKGRKEERVQVNGKVREQG
jgi:hypothetical protein